MALHVIATAAPLVFLDSGQSADESAFLDLYRTSLHRAYRRERDTQGRFWVIYPTTDLAKRYGLSKSLYGDEPWISWNTRARTVTSEHERVPGTRANWTTKEWVMRRGIAQTMAAFEPNNAKFTPDAVPSYRRGLSRDDIRATIALLNPTQKDLEFVIEHRDRWQHSENQPRMVLGSHIAHKLPPGFHSWLWGMLCWSRKEQKELAYAFQGAIIKPRYLNWHTLFHTKSLRNTAFWSFPGSFGHSRRIRKPELGNFLYERAALRASCRIGGQGDAWEDVNLATDCRNYVILTHSEEDAVPFDAYIALARGAKVIAPDIPLYRSIDSSKVVLYPCRSTGNNGASWSPMDLVTWFRSRYGIPNG